MLKVHLKTFGCQMNVYDSEVALGFLKGIDCHPVTREEDADVILFNTCSVREHAETRVYERLHYLKKAKAARPNLVIGLLGCMVEEHREKLFDRFPHLDLLCGTRNLRDLPQLVSEVQEKRTQAVRIKREGLGIEYLETAVRNSEIHAYLPIMTGCNKSCTYCIVPFTRGPEVSMAAREVYRETERLVGEGVKHITLLGQNVNSYGKDQPDEPSFSRLLSILNDVEGIERISFTTSHPEDAVAELFESIRDCKKVSRRFHLPLQSGSNRILKRMKRLHTLDEFREKVDHLRRLVPDISLTTDIIVGFPGERDEDFLATQEMLKTIRFDGAFIYKYSERPGTPAVKLKDDVPFEVKKRRNQELLDLQNKITEENNQAMIGQRCRVLVEHPSMKNDKELLARSSQDKRIVLSAQDSRNIKIGDVVAVQTTSLIGDTFRARLYAA